MKLVGLRTYLISFFKIIALFVLVVDLLENVLLIKLESIGFSSSLKNHALLPLFNFKISPISVPSVIL